MIVFFNCKISDIRLTPQPRYNLRNDNRFDVARYSFASFAPLAPLVSKFIFYLEMADGHAGQEAEMQQWLEEVLPKEKLSLHWHRCNNIAQWREAAVEIDAIDDNLIFPAGNEDHIFMDSNTEVFRRGLELISNDPDPAAVLMTSHYPEGIRSSHYYKGELSACGNYVSYTFGNNDALRVMKKEFFNWYLDQVKDPNMLIFRTEHWNNIILPTNKIYIPTKEQFRHYDGYAHVKIGPGVVPPLEIPNGFFTDLGMTIKYGFDVRDNNAVNINPLANALYSADPVNGTDYKFTLDDLPAFWRPHIRQCIKAPYIDNDAMRVARDQHFYDMTKVDIDWHHVGVKFDQSNLSPAKWIQNHMLVTQLQDPPKPKLFGSSLSSISLTH